MTRWLKHPRQLALIDLPEPKPRSKNRHLEADLQKSIVRALDLLLIPPSFVQGVNPEVRESGKEAAIAQGIAKAMGAKPGFTDTLVVGPSPLALFMEIKLPGEDLSEAQEDMAVVLRDGLGWHWAVVRSIEEAESAVRAAGIPMRKALIG